MNKLKFGHRVIAWDEDKSEAIEGKYVCRFNGLSRPHTVWVADRGDIEDFINCELDPDATEFLSGDEIIATDFEDSFEKGAEQKGTYLGYDPILQKHAIRVGSCNYPFYKYCRYPQPEPKEVTIEEIGNPDIIIVNGNRYIKEENE